MSRALEPVESCEILKRNPSLTWSDGAYRYSIARSGGGYRYSVTDGKESGEATLLYAFGQGKAGQTYLYRKDGQFYESRASYYDEKKGLDLTIGAQNVRPENIGQALGRVITPGDARDCFGCHTTGARRGGDLRLEHFEGGVQCEDCHGPGAEHAAGVMKGEVKPGAIRSLKGLTAEETNDLCGACHRTWETVMLRQIRGTANVRFQPYRLTNSPCYTTGDSRIACTACHDPHAALAADVRYYDSKCAACHNAANTAIAKRTCKVGKEKCVTCHMPRYEAPGSHHAFFDHWIRVARAQDPYPD
ncbi:MAG: cytochrome c3 family protein [Acidobacteriota bacterium]|nr:cytochrome c3 family protein [Acidobacteriota bacterium]